MAKLAGEKLAAAAESGAVLNGAGHRYDAKIKTARFYFTKLLPQVHALSAQIASGAAPVMELEPAAF